MEEKMVSIPREEFQESFSEQNKYAAGRIYVYMLQVTPNVARPGSEQSCSRLRAAGR